MNLLALFLFLLGLLLLAGAVLFFWAVDSYADLVASGFGGAKAAVTWALGAYLPLASLIFLFLAQRAIKKDEALVRAADRLRG